MSNYIEHHGVKGMKWGQRKAKKSSDGKRIRGGISPHNNFSTGVTIGLLASSFILPFVLTHPVVANAISTGYNTLKSMYNDIFTEPVSQFVSQYRSGNFIVNRRGDGSFHLDEITPSISGYRVTTEGYLDSYHKR